MMNENTFYTCFLFINDKEIEKAKQSCLSNSSLANIQFFPEPIV